MKLAEFIIREVSIPFNTTFSHSLASKKQSSSVVFEIRSDSGICGYGEGTPRSYVTGETIQSTVTTLRKVSKIIMNLRINSTDNVLEKISSIEHRLRQELSSSPSAKSALELALLDLYGKLLSKPAITFFGERLTSDIFYSGVLSEGRIEKILKITDALKVLKIKQVKIKAGHDLKSDLKKVGIIRAHLGNDVELRVDANGAWDLKETVERVERYCTFGVTSFEQPMPVGLKREYPVLLKKLDKRTKIIVDESICTHADAIWFIKNKGASGFNLKVSKHGGLISTLSIHRLASENGLKNQLGCHVGETSILTAAGTIFAGLTNTISAYEGAYGTHLLSFDIVRQPLQFEGRGYLNLEKLTFHAGLGIQIDSGLLDSASEKIYTIGHASA